MDASPVLQLKLRNATVLTKQPGSLIIRSLVTNDVAMKTISTFNTDLEEFVRTVVREVDADFSQPR